MRSTNPTRSSSEATGMWAATTLQTPPTPTNGDDVKHSTKSRSFGAPNHGAMGAQHPRHTHDNVNVKRSAGVRSARQKPRPVRQHGRKAR